jgi:iron complex outermembrane receptor protein
VNAGLQVHKTLLCRANAGSIFRYPTLNDLYWNPGGNPSLKPEKGFSEEGSILWNYPTGKFSFSFTGTLFNRNINNWIMWLPGKNGIWSPQNVPSVWSRGGETNSEVVYTNIKFKASFNMITNYVVSTRTQSNSENDNSVDKQLPYVPMYSGSGIFTLQTHGVTLRAVYSYTGYRYLSSDNYDYLSPYHLLDLRIAYTLPTKKMLVNIFAEGSNLLNENYFSVSQYPMPLRNFKVGLIFQYSKPIKHKI